MEAVTDQAPAGEPKPTLASLTSSIAGSLTENVPQQDRCLTQAVYFEARGEPLEGQLAVAQVVLNRVADPRYPNSICEVVFQNDHRKHRCQFSFACDGKTDKPANSEAWDLAKAVAYVAKTGQWQDMSKGSTHYHAIYVSPFWREHLHPTVQWGQHVFYTEEAAKLREAEVRLRPRNRRLTDTAAVSGVENRTALSPKG